MLAIFPPYGERFSASRDQFTLSVFGYMGALSLRIPWALLIQAHLHLVVHVAQRYQPYGVACTDLMQEGSLAGPDSIHDYADPQCAIPGPCLILLDLVLGMSLFQSTR